jgi:hypothetical protein
MQKSENTTKNFWIHASLASLTAILLTVTLLFPEWIEIFLGFDPDGGSGVTEWAIVAALFSATVIFTMRARFEWVRLHSSTK